MTTTLNDIQHKGRELAALKARLQENEAAVTTTKEVIRQIEEDHLPQLMLEMGIEGLDLAGGGRIELKDFVQTSIPIARQAEAFNWLRETQNDGIIKNEIKVSLGRGEDEKAARIKEDLTLRGVAFDQKQSIHPSTLKAFVTEALNNPDLRATLPMEAFAVHEGQKVVFK